MSEQLARREVAARAAGRCETCGRDRPGEWGHRLARSSGGLWEPWNGLHQDRQCHALAHAHPGEADEAGIRLVHRGPEVRPQDVPVWRWHQEWAAFGWWLLRPAVDGGPHVAELADPGEFGLPPVPAFAALIKGGPRAAHAA